MGPRMHQLLATLCVASSLALVALGSSDLTFGFCHRILSFGRPLRIKGSVGDMTSISRTVVAGVMCEE
jgi:hypothetical protein